MNNFPFNSLKRKHKMGNKDRVKSITEQKNADSESANSPDNKPNETPGKNSSVIDKIMTNNIKVRIAIIGGISAAAIPIWQIYFVETSNVSIEIASIIREESNDANIQLKTDELKQLEHYIPDTLLYDYNKQGKRGDKLDFPAFSISVLIKAFDKSKQDIKNIAAINNLLREYQTQIKEFINENDNKHILEEFHIANLKKWSLSRYIEDTAATYYETQLLAITRSYSDLPYNEEGLPILNLAAVRSLLVDVGEDLEKVSVDNNIRLSRLRNDIRNIESQIEKLKKDQSDKYSRFKVEIVAFNNGRAATSLRPLALMRVQISQGNYADVYLTMINYSKNSELAAGATKIIHYISDQLITFPKGDQTLINNFWGSTAWFHVYTIDTSQNIFTSNHVPFADSVHRKVIFDKLKEVASDNKKRLN